MASMISSGSFKAVPAGRVAAAAKPAVAAGRTGAAYGGGAVAGGLTPLTGAQIANTIAGYTRGMPAPLSQQQIQTQAQGEISPIVKAITDSLGGAASNASHAAIGYSHDLAAQLAQYQGSAADIYGKAEQAQAAADAAETGAIRGTGTQLASDLAGKLAQIGAPAGAADAVTPVGANATGAANATLGVGSSYLSNLIGQGAAAREYAGKLPGIAGLQGTSDARDIQLAAGKNIADQTQQAEAQLPTLVQNLENQSDSRSANRTNLAAQLYQYLTGQNLDITKYDTARSDALAAGTAKNATTVAVAKVRAQTATEAAAAKAAQTSFTDRLQFAKTYGYDPVTNQTLPGYTRDPATGAVVKAQKTSKAATKGQLTDSQAAKLVQTWHDGKPTSITTEVTDPTTGATKVNATTGKPITETKTQATGQLKYGQAYAMLRNYGYSDVKARQLLDTVYAKGDSGRAWITNEEQAALKAAGRQPSAGTFKDKSGQVHAYLVPAQVDALKAAGAAPAGEAGTLRGKPVYWIRPGF